MGVQSGDTDSVKFNYGQCRTCKPKKQPWIYICSILFPLHMQSCTSVPEARSSSFNDTNI